MEQAPEKIALVDMDGTIADYDLAMREGLARIASPGESITAFLTTPGEVITPVTLADEPRWLDARKMLIKNIPGFWRSLPRIEAGFRVVSMLRTIGFDTLVLTKGPFRTTAAWTEKVEWCREHLPQMPVTITEDKGIVYGRVLFDDWPAYMTRWLKWRPRGIGIMLESEWNQGFSHPNVHKVRRTHVDEDLEKIQPILQAAFDR